VLTFSSTSFVQGTSASGTIIGATAGSTITAIGLPAGLRIDGPARTFNWDGTGAVGSGTILLTESLADSADTPQSSLVNYSISGSLRAGTLTQTSTAGTNPPTWDSLFPDGQDGDTVELYYTTNGSTPTATGTPQGSVTYDSRYETINWGSSWPTAFTPGATVKWAERYGRVVRGVTVWSPLSNVLTDTMAVLTTADFVLSNTQPPDVGFGGLTTQTRTADFVAGRPVFYVQPSSPVVTGITVNDGTTNYSCVKVLNSGADNYSGIWVCPTALSGSGAGTYSFVTTAASATANACPVITGTLINAASHVPVTTALLDSWGPAAGTTVTPVGTLTVSTGGVGVIFGTMGGGQPITVNNSTSLISNADYGGSPDGAAGKQTTAGSWTPSIAQGGNNIAMVLAATWDKA
jgi:hypothetical protein